MMNTSFSFLQERGCPQYNIIVKCVPFPGGHSHLELRELPDIYLM